MSTRSLEGSVSLGIVYHAMYVWDMLQDEISDLIWELFSFGSITDSIKKSVNDSLDSLTYVKDAIRFSKYAEDSDPHIFRELMGTMKDAFTKLYRAFFESRNIPISGDGITHLNKEFYKTNAKIRAGIQGLLQVDIISQGCSTVTTLVGSLYNSEKHAVNKPKDPIAGNESFGNIFTLCSVFMLSLHGFAEDLRTWRDTLKCSP